MQSFFKAASTIFSAGLVALAGAAALYHGSQPSPDGFALASPASGTPAASDGVPLTRLAPLSRPGRGQKLPQGVSPLETAGLPVTRLAPLAPGAAGAASYAKPAEGHGVVASWRGRHGHKVATAPRTAKAPTLHKKKLAARHNAKT